MLLTRSSLRRFLALLSTFVVLVLVWEFTHRGHYSVYDEPLDERTRFTPYWTNKEPSHTLLPNGLLTTNMQGRHPVLELVEQGERVWNDMLASQSQTLAQAVAEYKRRYKRDPPRGFDHWWRFCVEHNVILVDEFDHIHQNMEPFWALSPARFRARVEGLRENLPFSFHIHIRNGYLRMSGPNSSRSRATDMAALIEPLAQWLPNLSMYASDHDRGNIVLGQDQYDEARSRAASGTYLSEDELTHYESFSRNPRPALRNACSPTSPAADYQHGPPNLSDHSFVYDFVETMNYCTTPSLMYHHGVWSFHHTHETRLKPMFVHCKWRQDPSFLMPALPAFQDIIRDDVDSLGNVLIKPWDQRSESRLFWRARSTGIDFATGWDWREAHRVRLHFLANPAGANVTRAIPLLEEEPVERPKWFQWKKQTRKLTVGNYTQGELVRKYFDLGLVGPLLQCDATDRPVCDEARQLINWMQVVPQSKGQDAKFVIDVDGNGWSQRFGRLLSTGSVVFKSTVFPEWVTPWLIPFYHFVPAKVDYSDLFDLMAFFSGYPNGEPGHDDIAEGISKHAIEFVRKHWRWEDMQAYMFRLLLEYARLGEDDRDAASFHL